MFSAPPPPPTTLCVCVQANGPTVSYPVASGQTVSEESVAQSKSTPSRKPKLSTIERGHQNGWVTVTYSAWRPPWEFFGVKFCADSTKVLWMRLSKPRSPVRIRMQTKKQSHTHIKDPGQSTAELGGLWKQQNNPAGTKMTVMASFCGRWSLAEEEEPFSNMLLFSFCVWIIQLFCYSSASFSPTPWYNCTGWLGIKHQVTYLLILHTYTTIFFILFLIHPSCLSLYKHASGPSRFLVA